MAERISEQRRSRSADRHSSRVAWLKVVLPLIALAILSTLFLLADPQDSERAIRYSERTYDGEAISGRVGRPDYTGIGQNGAGVTLTAADAWPDGSGGEITASDLTGTWEGTSGGRVVASSVAGVVGADRSSAVLTGEVEIVSDAGYRLTSEKLKIDMEAGRMVSPGPVTGTGPQVRIEAGAMDVLQQDAQPLITFTDGVKVIYDQASAEGTPP